MVTQCLIQEARSPSRWPGRPTTRLDWDVRLLSVDGTVVGAQRVTGGSPPTIKHGDGPGIGSSPRPEILEWLPRVLDPVDLFFRRSGVDSVAVSPNGDLVAAGDTADVDATRFNDASTIAFAPDGAVLAAGSVQGLITPWDLRSGQEIRRFRAHDYVTDLTLAANGQDLISGGLDGIVKRWDLEAR